MPNVAVIIPFYQNSAGILIKAINSALAQRTVSATIVVVDDASPISARTELAEVMRAHPGRIVIIEQPNAGPAAARNRALDHLLPAGTDLVAFLDSDDEWIDEHLANAVAAMGTDYDFYFTDHYQLNQSVSAFTRAKRIEVEQHPQIGNSPHLRAFGGDMFNQILIGNIIGTSTVVFRFANFPTLRFREEFVNAGEDYLFWLDLASMTKKIVFSSLCECTYGEGVNIFAGSGWGTEKSLVRLHYEIKYKKSLLKLFALTNEQRRLIKRSVATLRRAYVADVLHRLLHKKPIGWKLTRNHLRIDPESFLYFFPLTVSILLRR